MNWFKRMKPKQIKKLVSVGVFALLLLLFVVFDVFARLEYRVQDAVFQRPGSPSPGIVIIGIDDYAMYTFGPWPWPRSVIADAVNVLNSDEATRPAVIGIDIMYTDRSLFFPEGDDALVEAVYGAGNVVMAASAVLGHCLERQAMGVIVEHFIPFDGLLPHVEHGLVNAALDDDGVIRNALLWQSFHEETLYSFPVVISMMYQGVTEPDEFIQENRYMFIRYAGLPGIDGNNGDFFGYSLAALFKEDFDMRLLADRIVLIGPYAAGLMDYRPVPIYPGAPMHGVEIHANVIQAILDGAFKLYIDGWITALLLTAFLLIGMVMGELMDIRIVIPVLAALGVGYVFAAVHIYNYHFYVMPVLGVPLLLGIILIYQIAGGYIVHLYEKIKLRNTFKKYVDPKLVDTLIESGAADSNGVGSKREIAVLFVDVRGFTPMTESLRDTPERIVATLNDYLELTTTAVFNNGGSVDKFIGDATMALFNGFVPQEDYIYKAVKAAWDMVRGAAAVNASVKEKYGVDIGFGIGVHCGEAVVGNLGSSFRKDYTAIGNTVNTAARLESNARKSQVLISSDVYEALKNRIDAESIGEIELKGISEKLEVYALTGIKAPDAPVDVLG